MSIELPHDPRTALVRTKYFNQYPQPLERWLWQQGLPQAAERVFWVHWAEGKRNGDWCSEMPIKRVALECCVDVSTVTRSYQVLKTKGLIKREDPGRDPGNPFCQATAITEVRLPREFLTELARSPNRPTKDTGATESAAVQAPARTAIVQPIATTVSPENPAIAPGISRGSRPSRQDTQALWGRVSDAERARFFTASRDRLTSLEFDTDTRLTPEDRGQILAQLAQLAAAKPAPTARAPSAAKPSYVGPRRLSVLDLARTRKRILEAVPAAAAPEMLRQVLWAVEQGALRRFDLGLALNIALKKIREGAWSKPNRMPPNWIPAVRGGERAVPEQCSAA
jgi:site-specific DNA-cytosine methylase